MDFKSQGRKLLWVAALTIFISACGSDKKDTTTPVTQPTPPVSNVAPKISSSIATTATEDILYSFQITVEDPDDANDGIALQFTLNNAPDGMSVSSTGLINWTPSEGILTSGSVELSVTDGGEDGSSPATQAFEITVQPVNDPVVITSTTLTSAVEDILYSFQITTEDPDDINDGSGLQFSLTNAPTGMVVSNTGLITWTATEGVLTSGNVELSVVDGGEDNATSATQEFEITVIPVNDAPTVASLLDQNIEAGNSLSLQIEVTDVDDLNTAQDINFEILQGPDSLAVSNSGLITYNSTVTESISNQVVIKVSDGGEDGAQSVNVSFILTEQFFIQLVGEAANYFTGQVIQAAEVKISNGSEITNRVFTDVDGTFSVKVQDIQLTEQMTISADTSGFAQAAITISESEFSFIHRLLLQPITSSHTINLDEPAELKVGDVLIVSLPANSLVNEQGEVVSTAVVAELTIINPEIDIELMPGDMITQTESGELQPIESFGAITVSFVDETGNPLQLTDNQTATIRIPATGAVQLRPETIPLYYYDDILGYWIEEGEATLTNDNGTQFYEGSVTHFTTWNADQIYDTAYINGCVVDESGQRLTDARIISQGRNYSGSSNSFTDADGNFSLAVKKSSIVLIAASIGLQSRTLVVGVAQEDIQLEECLVLSEALTKFTLNWGESPRDLDSHLFINLDEGRTEHVYFSNKSVTIEDTVIFLDVDDTSSYGPEVISIPQFPAAGQYRYYIYNYSRSPDIEPINTRVEIVYQNRRQIVSPPQEGITRNWHVADFIVADDGTVEFIIANEWVGSLNESQVAPIEPQSIIPFKKIDDILSGLISSKYYAK